MMGIKKRKLTWKYWDTRNTASKWMFLYMFTVTSFNPGAKWFYTQKHCYVIEETLFMVLCLVYVLLKKIVVCTLTSGIEPGNLIDLQSILNFRTWQNTILNSRLSVLHPRLWCKIFFWMGNNASIVYYNKIWCYLANLVWIVIFDY